MRFGKLLCSVFLGSALALVLIDSTAQASLVVDDPPVDLGGPNILVGSTPRVDSGDFVCHTITSDDVLNGQIFFQFEANENNNSIQLRLNFYEDETPDSTLSVDDTWFFDFDTAPGDLTLDGLQTLNSAQNQTTYEWRISGIDSDTLGHEICVSVDIADQTNGFERAQFAQSSIVAVPEPSQVLLGGLLCCVLGATKFGSRRRRLRS